MRKLSNYLKQFSYISIIVILYIGLFLFIPKEYSNIGIIPIRLFINVIFIGLIVYGIFKGKIEINKDKKKSILIYFILFILCTIPSLILTKSIVTSLYTMIKFTTSFIIFYLLFRIKISDNDINLIKKVGLIYVVIFSIGAIIKYIFNIDLNLAGIIYYTGAKGRVNLTFFNTCYFGIFINLVSPITLYLYFKSNDRKNIIKYFIINFLMFITLIFTFTRSSFIIYMIILVCLICLLYKHSLKVKTLLYLVLIFSFIVVIPGGAIFAKKSANDCILMLKNSSSIFSFLPMFDEDDIYLDYDDNSEYIDYSMQHRKEFAKIAKKIAKEHIFTGVGIGTYMDYMESDDFKIEHPEYTLERTHPHSSMILMYAECGVFGIIAFIALGISFAIMPTKSFIKYFKYKDIRYDLLAVILVLVFSFILVNVMAENALYDTQIFALFIIIYSILYKYICNREEII